MNRYVQRLHNFLSCFILPAVSFIISFFSFFAFYLIKKSNRKIVALVNIKLCEFKQKNLSRKNLKKKKEILRVLNFRIFLFKKCILSERSSETHKQNKLQNCIIISYFIFLLFDVKLLIYCNG